MSATTLPAPIGGWNARDSLAMMEPTDAITLENLIPAGESVKTRPGYVAHSNDLTTAVKTLVTYHGATEKLICAANGHIRDVSATGAGTSLGSGFTNDAWQTTEFKNRLIFCNGSDAVRDYDGTTLNTTAVYTTGANVITNGTFDTDSNWSKGTGWSIADGQASSDGSQVSTSNLSQASVLTVSTEYEVEFTVSNYSAGSVTPYCGTAAGTARSADGTHTETITCAGNTTFLLQASADFVGSIDNVTVKATDSTVLVDCVTHKGRVYYVQKDSQSFWYAGAGAYAGSLTEYAMDEFTTTGGSLMTMISWSRDGGSGVDDLAAFLFDTGEVLVYAGSDPGSTTDWQMLGRFRIGRPLGRRCATKIGGDVIILTVDGYVPLTAALQEGRYSEQSDFSWKIDRAAKDAAQTYRDVFGWSAFHWPQASLFIVNVPISSNQSVQHVRNTTTGSWCKFTNVNALCWAEYDGNVYYGSPDGKVYKVAGTSDAGGFIDYRAVQAFNYFGSPAVKKQITAVEPITNFAYPKYIDSKFHADHNIKSLPTFQAPPEPTPSDWGVGEWDVAEWVIDVPGSKTARRSVIGNGYALAHAMRFKSRAQTVTWYATHYWLKSTGIV